MRDESDLGFGGVELTCGFFLRLGGIGIFGRLYMGCEGVGGVKNDKIVLVS